jgi:amidophosphoribosyltransferase
VNDEERLRHYCGLAGIWGTVPANIPERLFYMLFSLQHRGQEGAGISWEDPGTGKLEFVKDTGMVSAVLGKFLHSDTQSRVGIGHVRYSTAGGSGPRNAQPHVVVCNKGNIALAHNGNISNSDALRAELSEQGAIFQTTSDTEIILHLMSRSRQTEPEAIIREAFGRLEGAFSVIMIWNGRLYALRDPDGFRPLYYAKCNGEVMVGSETCALQFSEPVDCVEVAPGQVICFDTDGQSTFNLDRRPSHGSRCVFELIYFARPDSGVFGTSVHETRLKFGAALADIDPVKGDVVIPVPDSGNIAAIGYARRSGIPFDFGLSRNHYAGRSFIMPTKGQRELAVRMKLRPVREVVEGKRVIMIDDTLVRGTTAKIIVGLLKEAGAKEVHIRLSAPEIHWPCYFGIDIPTREELYSNRYTPEEIARELGADSVLFLPQERLDACLSGPENYCHSCFDGKYPCEVGDQTQTCANKGACQALESR